MIPEDIVTSTDIQGNLFFNYLEKMSPNKEKKKITKQSIMFYYLLICLLKAEDVNF